MENREFNTCQQADVIGDSTVNTSSWTDEEFEEMENETPWEIFSLEIDNWATLNIHSTDL